jgi:hypothetical protein
VVRIKGFNDFEAGLLERLYHFVAGGNVRKAVTFLDALLHCVKSLAREEPKGGPTGERGGAKSPPS